ncbi:MAG TPA: TadE/TadG family type IV pilus assembly protein [Magnetospirillum sp.]|nr:TadE/TadG family type IV pilus assembly protein [Magnetospirillum sp.]
MIRRLRGDRRGVAALEAALIFPIAVIILVGFTEMYFYMRAVNIVERTSVTVADLLARRQTLLDCAQTTDSAYLGTYFHIGEIVAQPLVMATNGQIVAAAVIDTGAGPTIAWQRRSPFSVDTGSPIGTDGAAAKLPVTTVAVPNPALNGDTLIVASVAYRFRPFEGVRVLLPSLPGEVMIVRTAYARARFGALGALPGQPGCTASPSL